MWVQGANSLLFSLASRRLKATLGTQKAVSANKTDLFPKSGPSGEEGAYKLVVGETACATLLQITWSFLPTLASTLALNSL